MRTLVRRQPRRTRRAVGALVVASALTCGVLPPVPSGAAPTSRVYFFASVSCVSGADCFVVGSSTLYDAGSQPSTPLIMRWNGTKWSTMRSANRAGQNMSSLSDVSCTAPDFCMAVGESATVSNPAAAQPLVERWDGHTWKLLQSAPPLRQVSCTSRKFCMAVGGRTVARWDGSKWTIVPVVKVAAGQQFRAVSCVREEACFAVGDFSDAFGFTDQVAERWNGKRLLVTPRLAAPRGYFNLSALACANSAACFGAGAFTDGGLYSNIPFAPRWNGSQWSDSQPASPSAITSQLSGVACPSATSCFASGGLNSGTGPAGYPHPFLDHWNGAKWLVASAPAIYGGLSDVACATTTSCLAVGESQTLEGGDVNPYLGISSTLALRWDGHTWTRVTTPNPS